MVKRKSIVLRRHKIHARMMKVVRFQSDELKVPKSTIFPVQGDGAS
jgi:hypothetical protein